MFGLSRQYRGEGGGIGQVRARLPQEIMQSFTYDQSLELASCFVDAHLISNQLLNREANPNQTKTTMADDLNLTLFHPPSSKTDAISLPPSTTLSDLSSFASAILGLDDESIVISKDSFASLPLLFSPTNAAVVGSKALGQCGISNGDLLSVMTKVRFHVSSLLFFVGTLICIVLIQKYIYV